MRQQQDEPGRFSICSRQAAVVPEFIKYHCSKDEINDLSKMIERWL
uniref:Uncharacterized protein n=1 Tax=Escherichia coli TaxID=562 RepID=A0A2R4A8X8_ECOLX|nr:hypothetical protein [Escherichia coli]QTG67479.1 hypothetical protein [Escherichia coli]UMW90727.1 hypothetical protein [Escherichia coli]